MRVLCKDIHQYANNKVEVAGWVHRIRELGGVSFIILRDRSGISQIVTSQFSIDSNNIKQESVIQVEGEVVFNEKAPNGVEIHNPQYTILSTPTIDLPMPINTPVENLGIDTILSHRVYTLRMPKIRAIFEIQSAIIDAFSSYLLAHDFTEIKTSKIINSGSEGGTGLFEIDYFDNKAYLAQSPQLYKQIGVSSGLEQVFEIGAAYRAEKHETNRHLNEYVSLDVEMGFINSLQPLLHLEIQLLAHILRHLKAKCEEQFKLWNVEIIDPILLYRIPSITYEHAKEIASRESGNKVLEIDPNAEKVLSQWAKEDVGIPALFITEYPRRKRPFYTMPDESGQKTLSFDFIFNGVEITSGGLRQHRYEELLESVKKFNMDPTQLNDYLSIFKYGCPPHGGFAIGLERITQLLLGISNVKMASMFPRDRNRITP